MGQDEVREAFLKYLIKQLESPQITKVNTRKSGSKKNKNSTVHSNNHSKLNLFEDAKLKKLSPKKTKNKKIKTDQNQLCFDFLDSD